MPGLWLSHRANTLRPDSPRLVPAVALFLCLGSAAALAQSIPASASQAPAVQSSALFVDTAEKAGLHFTGVASHTSRKYLLETMGSGVAVFDYDNDGLLDVLLINGAPLDDPTPKGTIPKKRGPQDWNRLFHQKKDGTFEDVTEKSGLKGVGYGLGVAIGDYDNDGFEDVFVTEYGGNHLYHNNGNGTFTDVTAASGTGGSTKPGEGWSTSAAWVDLDNDGLLDLVVLRYVQWDFEDVWCGEHREGYRAYCHPDIFPAIRPLVYHNNGNGTFTEVGETIGMGAPGKGLGIAINDFDRDGRMDLAIANDSMPEFLFHNLGRNRMEEVGLGAEIAVDGEGRTYAGMGIDFQDYNNDGFPDLVITNLANQKYALYRNNGDGSFTYDSYAAGIARSTLLHSGWGIHFLDYDNDGIKDLLVAQGHDLDTIELNFPQLHYKEPMLLLHGTGDNFIDVSKTAGAVFTQAWAGRGMAVGDLDNDGRLDAVVATNGGQAHLLHNETTSGNHWLTLNLVGHKSNRDGIGAEVKLTAGKLVEYETASTSGSYLSSSDKRVHFGLGKAKEADAIEIRWPSGIVQNLQHVAADRVVTVDETETAPAQHPK
jgi:hypothetical protein